MPNVSYSTIDTATGDFAATAPEGFQMKPLESYERTHHTFNDTRLTRALNFLQNIVEGILMKFSAVGDLPVFEVKNFPWVEGVEADWRKVRAELDTIMQYRDAMPSFQDIVKEVSAIQNDDQWKTFFLRSVGMDCEENARRCPETMKVLEKIPGCTTAFFSILSPHKHIPEHRGPWAGVLRLHLGLLVPEPARQCRIRIANQIHPWQEGRCLIFDDTYNHEVWNDTDGYRVVLFIDFARPLRWPMNVFNIWLMNLSTLAPFLREAKGRQKASEKKFWEAFAKKA
jgi:beta-hydroxylase